jgi:hypothetical protein
MLALCAPKPLGAEEHVLLMPLKDAFAALKTPHPTRGRAVVFALQPHLSKTPSTHVLQFRLL